MALVWGFSSQNIVAHRDLCAIFYYSLIYGYLIYEIGFNVTSILRVKEEPFCVNVYDVYIYVIGLNTYNVNDTYTVFLF